MRAKLCLLAMAAVCAPAQLVKDWHAVETPHFEAVSRYDPAKVEALLGDLEWARGVFETHFGLKSRLDRKVLILIPDSPFDYEQLSPAKRAAGYYLAAPWRDMIVLRELLKRGARYCTSTRTRCCAIRAAVGPCGFTKARRNTMPPCAGTRTAAWKPA
jgi:hypothetical protein